MTQSAADKLLPCPFCGGEVTQKITLINTGSYRPFKHVAEIEHYCGINSYAPKCNALELFFGDKENRELLDKVAEHQRVKWNTRHNPEANALKIAVSAPDDAMCDAARGFILGLDMSVRTFEGMRKHLEALGEPIPDWMPSTGHITKWDVAQCIYNLMRDVRLAEIEREAKKGE